MLQEHAHPTPRALPFNRLWTSQMFRITADTKGVRLNIRGHWTIYHPKQMVRGWQPTWKRNRFSLKPYGCGKRLDYCDNLH